MGELRMSVSMVLKLRPVPYHRLYDPNFKGTEQNGGMEDLMGHAKQI